MSAPARLPVGWDDPWTAESYEEFCVRHGRYREANDALVAHAALSGDLEILDLAAGTGRTAEAALLRLSAGARVLCVEPAAAMRAAAEKRLSDARARWAQELPAEGAFDRILCGAAIWQLLPLEATFRRLRLLLAPGGALVFDVPSLYLGEPEEPGGGEDPMLVDLLASFARGRPSSAPAVEPLPDAAGVAALLGAAGFRPERWTFEVRLTQETLRDWLKIPVLTDSLAGDVSPRERARLLDAAFEEVDADSWRREKWTGFTAWAV